jgi:metal-responsive CopG/Arc/MetJ family transcriptional regulator
MVRVTISLPDDLAARAETLAAGRGVSVNELACEAVEAYVLRLPEPTRRTLSFIGLGTARSGFSARESEEQLEAHGFVTSP